MNPRSITFRLVSWYCAALLLMGGTFAFATYYGFNHYVVSVLNNTLRTRAEDVRYLAVPLVDDPAELRTQIERRFAPEAHNRVLRVFVAGQSAYRSGNMENGASVPDVIPFKAGSRFFSDGDLYVYRLEQRLPDGRPLVIQSGQSAHIVSTAREGLIYSLLAALPLLLSVAAVGGFGLVRRALTPVTEIVAAADRITAIDLHRRLDVAETGDVIEELGTTLNGMLSRLEAAYLHVSRFSADAAHEMRTPLAVMRGELELVLLQRDVSPAVHAAVENAFHETLRLCTILDNLLVIEVVEGRGSKADKIIDLSALSAEVIDQMQLLADEKNMRLALQASREAKLRGDEVRIKQVVVNLVDNAIKYSHAGGQIDVDVDAGSDAVVLRVKDAGIGIPRRHQKKIFDRFYRVDPDGVIDGSGLGLSIVKSIVVAHGGTVTVESGEDGGSLFTVSIPRAAEAA